MKVFITLEGIDGCGKTTVTERLAAALTDRRIRVVTTREPGGSPLGDKVRELVKMDDIGDLAKLHLFLAARFAHTEFLTVMRGKGNLVLCDRYADSTVVYQGMASPHIERWIRNNMRTVMPCIPDLTLLLDVPAGFALKRIAERGSGEKESRVRLELLRERWLAWAKENPGRIVRVPAEDDLHTVVGRCVKHVLMRMEEHGRKNELFF